MRRFSPFLFAALILPFPSYAQSSEDVPPAAVPQARGTAVEVFSGAEYQSFDLGEGQNATKLSVPVAARVTAGRFRISAQVPYVRVSAPGNVIVPSSGPLGLPILVDPTRPAEVRSRDGLGDVRVGAAYDFPLAAVNVSLIGAAKLPTASTEKGLGTGEADYSVGAEVSTSLGTVTPFASASYTRNGDPEGVDLRDTLSGQAGAAVRFGSSASAHLGYSFAEGASAVSRDEQRVFGGLNSAIGERMSLGVYGSAGVNGPANIGAGVSLGIGLK
jgi:hypothetical protein